MIRVTVLGSGSRGNAILVDGTHGTVMVDAGFSRRALATRLVLTGRRPEEVSALLLTHEHADHAVGAVAASTRWGWPVHSQPRTLAALSSCGSPALPVERCHPLSFERHEQIAGFLVQSTPVPHDAASCAALVLTDQASGARVGIALDLGHVPASLPDALAYCDVLVVESNHDERMLAEGPYPRSLKRRIGGRHGHLSNGAAASLLAATAHQALRAVIVAHLSETNNTPATAVLRARAALRRAGWRHDTVYAAAQSAPGVPVAATGDAARGRLLTAHSGPLQLSLPLL